eukprot:SAG31_NODE_36542_length_312_cov_0.967136_1_plen_66_part_01
MRAIRPDTAIQSSPDLLIAASCRIVWLTSLTTLAAPVQLRRRACQQLSPVQPAMPAQQPPRARERA